MNKYTIKQLERMGKLKRKKVPNFTHKYTQDEYNKILNEIKQNLSEIQNRIGGNLNIVQNEILKICKNKILEVFHYYLNIRTWKVHKQRNQVFKKYIRELRNFKRKYLGTKNDERDFIDEMIDKLLYEYFTQRNYIMQLEKKIKSKKITPFEDTIEISENSIKKVFQ